MAVRMIKKKRGKSKIKKYIGGSALRRGRGTERTVYLVRCNKSTESKTRLRGGTGDDPNVIKCPGGFYFILNFSRRIFSRYPLAYYVYARVCVYYIMIVTAACAQLQRHSCHPARSHDLLFAFSFALRFPVHSSFALELFLSVRLCISQHARS